MNEQKDKKKLVNISKKVWRRCGLSMGIINIRAKNFNFLKKNYQKKYFIYGPI